ncbi:MAG TPA: class II fructose-bisphosphate aldolase [Candidatus Saccharimonadales bacterium]|nr:class II fructose-bisphosphate aldolase [Candidatus Saccharimonadales bacterium]
MPLTLRQMRKNCEAARATMARARAEHFALGAFNLDNQETLKAVVQAAARKKAPLMVEVSQAEVDAMGLDNVRDMVDNYKAESGIEMYINLDHSPTIAAAVAGIEAGFEFIHIDISQARKDATLQEIITETKQIVNYARLTGAMVESEPHYFGGGSNVFTKAFDYEEIKKTFSTPDGAKEFVDATGIDTYAAAVGNLHGKYPVPKKLDLALLQKIRDAIDCNISLHGGSDTPGHYFVDAVKIGVSKININSDMRAAYRKTLEKVLADNPTEYAVVKLMDTVIEAVEAVVEEKIDMFNSADKAMID